jgi:L-lactate utilization protein LutC
MEENRDKTEVNNMVKFSEPISSNKDFKEIKCANQKCNKTFIPPRRKFCSEVCRTRYNALKRYNKLKDSEEYKRKMKEYNARYYETHKEELKAKMKIYSAEYLRKKRAEKVKQETTNGTRN